MVFLFLLRQAMRQPVAVFAYKHYNFLRYRQKLQRLSGCYRKAVTSLAAQSSSSPQPTLSFLKLHSLRLHYISGLRCTQHLSFHYAFIHFSLKKSTGCNNWLACESPPAAWLSCLLQKRKKQKSRQPLAASSSHPLPSYFGRSVCHRWLNSQRLGRTVSANHYIAVRFLQPLWPTLAQGCITCFS